MVLMGEKFDIIILQGNIQYEHWERHKVIFSGRNVADADATERVAYLLGHKKDLVVEVCKDYISGKPLSVVNPKGK